MLRLRDVSEFFLLLPVLLVLLLYSDLGNLLIKIQLEKELSSRLETEIAIAKFDFSFPNGLMLYDITARRGNDETLRIKEINIDTPIIPLLFGNLNSAAVDFTSIQAMQADLPQLRVQVGFDRLAEQWNFAAVGNEKSLKQIVLEGSFSLNKGSEFFELATCKIGEPGSWTQLQNPLKIKLDKNDYSMAPARFHLGSSVLDIQFKGNSEAFNAGLYWHISSLESISWILPNVSLDGESTLNLNVGGSWADPIVKGNLALRAAKFDSLKSGACYQNINADCTIDRSGIQLRSFTSEDLSQGKVTATGSLEFDSEWLLPYQINLRLDRASLVDLEDVQSHFSGNAVFTGNRLGASLMGELNADEVDLILLDGKASASKPFNVTYINQSNEEHAPLVHSPVSNDWPIALNLHLKNKGTISISDEQFTSKWKGDVMLTGTPESPLVHGDCRLQLGEYLFNGKKFKLSQGTVAFNGDPRKKTQLYVVGEQKVGSILIEVILKGPVDDLELAFRSTPQLSEKEILCHLLFGRGTGEITSFEGAELKESINKLKNQGGEGPGLLSTLKKNLGIDRFDISHGTGTDNEEISVEVGKYLTPGVFIGVKKGITSDANRIGIEADLRKNIKLQAEIGDDSERHFHLKWKHDY